MSVPFAVLFDWDGVVVDSSRHHQLSWKELAAEQGLPLPEGFFKESFGRINRIIIPDLLGWTRESEEIDSLGRRKEFLYREIVKREGLTPLPGVRELLEDLNRHSVPRIVGTSAERENIRSALEIMGMEELFGGIVASEDVTHGKPDPEVFLKAAKLSGVPPERCVVLEDSHHGLDAARSGGMKTVGVLTTHPAEKLGAVDLLVKDLSELSFAVLGRLFDR